MDYFHYLIDYIIINIINNVNVDTISHRTFLTKNVPKENETECSKHINQTAYYPITLVRERPYVGRFSPQGNLNFSNTGAYRIKIYLNTTGPFSEFSTLMLAFDSGKSFFFFHRINNKSLSHFAVLIIEINHK